MAYHRRLAGLTQNQVAEALDLQKDTISRIENGNIAITVKRLLQFRDLYSRNIPASLPDDDPELNRQAAELARTMQKAAPEKREKIWKILGSLGEWQ